MPSATTAVDVNSNQKTSYDRKYEIEESWRSDENYNRWLSPNIAHKNIREEMLKQKEIETNNHTIFCI